MSATAVQDARLAALVQAAADAIVTAGADGRVETFNAGAERLFGVPAGEVLGRPCAEVLAAEGPDREAVEALLADARAGRRALARLRAQRAGGSGFAAEVSVAGAAGAVVAIVRDVTLQVERAARIERSNAELEELAYAASHDLQEPLRSIQMGAESVLRAAAGRLDRDERALLGHVGSLATRMSEQVQALLDLARVAPDDDDGGVWTPVPVLAVVRDAIEALRVPIEESRAVIDVQGTLPAVAMPRPELALVLQNLLGNAIKYRRPGRRPHVRVTGQRDGAWAVLRVGDDGVGLAAEQRERLLGERAAGDGAAQGTAGPGGLGLVLCRRIVQRRGGSIAVASAGRGRGTELTLRLPAGPG